MLNIKNEKEVLECLGVMLFECLVKEINGEHYNEGFVQDSSYDLVPDFIKLLKSFGQFDYELLREGFYLSCEIAIENGFESLTDDSAKEELFQKILKDFLVNDKAELHKLGASISIPDDEAFYEAIAGIIYETCVEEIDGDEYTERYFYSSQFDLHYNYLSIILALESFNFNRIRVGFEQRSTENSYWFESLNQPRVRDEVFQHASANFNRYVAEHIKNKEKYGRIISL